MLSIWPYFTTPKAQSPTLVSYAAPPRMFAAVRYRVLLLPANGVAA